MPRFMGFVKMEEGVGTPPQALFEAMDAFIGERAANGVFLDGGGLYGTEDAVNFVVRKGEVSRVDGPYAEAKEVVGGWSILQYDTVEEAVADQEQFAELHAKYWPEVTVVATLRHSCVASESVVFLGAYPGHNEIGIRKRRPPRILHRYPHFDADIGEE